MRVNSSIQREIRNLEAHLTNVSKDGRLRYVAVTWGKVQEQIIEAESDVAVVYLYDRWCLINSGFL